MSHDRIDALSRSLADSTSRRSLLTIFWVGVAGAAVNAAGLNAALAKKKNNKGNVNAIRENQLTNLPVRGKGRKGTFKGHVEIVRFEEGGSTGIQAVGLLTGKATGDAKKTGKGPKKSKNVNQQVVFPVQVTSQQVTAQATCTILNLVLGPITLELLGLTLRTNTIRIRLTGQTGTLLGGLLCEISDPTSGPLSDIVQLLTDILNALRGI